MQIESHLDSIRNSAQIVSIRPISESNIVATLSADISANFIGCHIMLEHLTQCGLASAILIADVIPPCVTRLRHAWQLWQLCSRHVGSFCILQQLLLLSGERKTFPRQQRCSAPVRYSYRANRPTNRQVLSE